MKTCTKCGKRKPATTEYFYRSRQSRDGFVYECKLCDRNRYREGGRATYRIQQAKRYREELRQEVISHYGGKCLCCGELELAFLAIDHVNGGGTKHRKKLLQDGTNIYLWLKSKGFPTGFQVLCHNCNFAKGKKGTCPHKKSSPRVFPAEAYPTIFRWSNHVAHGNWRYTTIGQ